MDQTLANDARAARAFDWARARLALGDAAFAPASTDASFRRYFRLSAGGCSWIVMDAPTQREDCRPFLKIAALMRDAGVHVPEVLAYDLAQGYLLLSDLGTRSYLDALAPETAEPLMNDAIETLVRWQLASRPGMLPEYDAALLRRELELFSDWYLARHARLALSGAQRAELETVFEALIAAAVSQPQVYVHRDYMPRNLMVSDPNPGVLDFQDAVCGPVAYDALCLFKDAFISWPPERVEQWRARYWQAARARGVPVPDAETFRRDSDWIGVQRHLKVMGIFARLSHRDGKPQYVADTPRFARYLREVVPDYQELSVLLDLLDRAEERLAAPPPFPPPQAGEG